MIVMKFGGSSLATADRLRQVVDLVAGRVAQRPCVVLSAMGSTTNRLFAAAEAARRGDLASALAETEQVFALAGTVAGQVLREGDAVHAAFARLRDDVETLLRGASLLRELTLPPCCR